MRNVMRYKLDLLRYNNELYIVLKRIAEDSIKDVTLAKELFGADIALRNNGQLWFCEKIEEAQIIN